MLLERNKPYVLRIVIFALLLQVLCPLFATIAAEYPVPSGKSTLHSEHHSITPPMLLKEKEESEEKTEEYRVDLIQLIDFTEHTYVLSDYHGIKFQLLRYQYQIDHQPPLFELHGVFLI